MVAFFFEKVALSGVFFISLWVAVEVNWQSWRWCVYGTAVVKGREKSHTAWFCLSNSLLLQNLQVGFLALLRWQEKVVVPGAQRDRPIGQLSEAGLHE